MLVCPLFQNSTVSADIDPSWNYWFRQPACFRAVCVIVRFADFWFLDFWTSLDFWPLSLILSSRNRFGWTLLNGGPCVRPPSLLRLSIPFLRRSPRVVTLFVHTSSGVFIDRLRVKVSRHLGEKGVRGLLQRGQREGESPTGQGMGRQCANGC